MSWLRTCARMADICGLGTVGLACQRLDESVLEALHIVRVDQVGLRQLSGRPGELAEQQRAAPSTRAATYSLATRFMPSRSGVTAMTSAAR